MADDDIREGDPERKKRKAAPPPDDDDDEDEEDRPRKRRIRRDDDDGDGGVSSVIPYRNAMALTAYYTGVFGVIACFLGPLAIFGAVPLICGVLGLMKASKDAEARGRVHAWVGVILGAIELLWGCGLTGLMGYGIITGK
jgi:hypothetical protein